MDVKDHYAILGIERTATAEQIKRAYRKLARKFHPDVSHEANAEARFKDVAEAYETLHDPERRAVHDQAARGPANGASGAPPPGWRSGAEAGFGGGFGHGFGSSHDGSPAGDQDAFFESLFGHQRAGRRGPQPRPDEPGEDHHASIVVDLLDAYRGAHRSLSLRVPVRDAAGLVTLQDRVLDVNIPKGIRAGQTLRLAGQGHPGHGSGKAGDLYLEIAFAAQTRFRIDGRDIYLDLPVAPWEAVLGATVTVPLPEGRVELAVPAGSAAGRKLRLRGKGIPGTPAGDVYALLSIALPTATGDAETAAWQVLARQYAGFHPRAAREG